MKSDPDNDFEALRRLLALKRHEQPPPRYFNEFSSRVIARIEAGERGEADVGWWQRLWAFLEAKPAFSGAFGAAICAVLISGMLATGESGQVAGTDSGALPFSPLVAQRPSDSLPSHVGTNGSESVRWLFEQEPLRVPAQTVSSPRDLLRGGN